MKKIPKHKMATKLPNGADLDISDSGSDISSDDSSQGWEDANGADDATEETPVVCLFCSKTGDSAHAVFEHAKEAHGFDWKTEVKYLGLDFYGRIKLVNYIRACTKAGTEPTLKDLAFSKDDKYLQPVLEDDTLLFSLDDEEEDEPLTAQDKVHDLEQKLADLSTQFAEYKEAVSGSFAKRLDAATDEKPKESERDDDTHYFTSYAYNEIHEIMLKDTVRTDAYRDFVYGNKHLFKDKVVLDVGCGTGVLSMFCAKAGAKKVISVDNSDIIDKCRANVFENKLDGVITCLRGKIEEVVLSVKQVDIIISEWMGYCLLYEAMLDSVLFARDRYLAPDGLMVPSECKILLSAVYDPEYMNDNINFWNHVYGFSMTAMKEKIKDDVDIIHLPADSLASEPVAFCHLPLHTVKVSDLKFTKPFELTIKQDIESLDGFLIHFDNFFATSRDQVIPEDAKAETWQDTKGGVAFTTGPRGKVTHWRQGLLLNEDGKNASAKAGDVIKGEITYREEKENSRALEVEVSWEVSGAKNKQSWNMR
ncbi:S-adenosyl-L-methionine-dependent methyltransferase [Geopyxis carbonaria]|nr:S-adenosyl-L-methionine-dependent methyltransferase [Geopyxis carbonaria]